MPIEEIMGTLRPFRTIGATLAGVGVLVASLYAGQDLWHYAQAISWGELEWARSGQGLWMLTCGIAEALATVILFLSCARLLGSKPILRGRHSAA